jgi:hypothetical protein
MTSFASVHLAGSESPGQVTLVPLWNDIDIALQRAIERIPFIYNLLHVRNQDSFNSVERILQTPSGESVGRNFQTVSEKSAATDQPIPIPCPIIRSRGNSAIWGDGFDHGKVAVATGERRSGLPNEATGMDAILDEESRVLNSAIKWPTGLRRRED